MEGSPAHWSRSVSSSSSRERSRSHKGPGRPGRELRRSDSRPQALTPDRRCDRTRGRPGSRTGRGRRERGPTARAASCSQFARREDTTFRSGSRMLTSTSPPTARSVTFHGSRRPIERSADSAECASLGLHAPRIRWGSNPIRVLVNPRRLCYHSSLRSSSDRLCRERHEAWHPSRLQGRQRPLRLRGHMDHAVHQG